VVRVEGRPDPGWLSVFGRRDSASPDYGWGQNDFVFDRPWMCAPGWWSAGRRWRGDRGRHSPGDARNWATLVDEPVTACRESHSEQRILRQVKGRSYASEGPRDCGSRHPQSFFGSLDRMLGKSRWIATRTRSRRTRHGRARLRALTSRALGRKGLGQR
jgi:hypothetical protein